MIVSHCPEDRLFLGDPRRSGPVRALSYDSEAKCCLALGWGGGVAERGNDGQ